MTDKLLSFFFQKRMRLEWFQKLNISFLCIADYEWNKIRFF